MDLTEAPVRRSTPQQFQRETNLALVLRSLRDVGPASRSELAARIGLDRSTMTSIAAELLEADIVRENAGEPAGSRGGRRPRLLSLREERVVAVGMQLGDRLAEWTICSLGGDSIGQGAIVREADDDPTPWASRAFTRLRHELATWQVRHDGSLVVGGVGLGVSGIVDPGLRVLRESTVFAVRDLDLGRIWEASDGSDRYPVLLVDNDANCCAWNIAHEEPDFGTTILVNLSFHHARDARLRPSLAGVGLSFVMNGRVYYGSNHAAGELRGYRWRAGYADQLGLPSLVGAREADALEPIAEELLRNLGVVASALDPVRIVLGGELAGRQEMIGRQIDGPLSETAVAPLYASGVLCVAAPDEYPVSLGAARMVLHEIFALPTVETDRNPDLGWQVLLDRLRLAGPSLRHV